MRACPNRVASFTTRRGRRPPSSLPSPVPERVHKTLLINAPVAFGACRAARRRSGGGDGYGYTSSWSRETILTRGACFSSARGAVWRLVAPMLDRSVRDKVSVFRGTSYREVRKDVAHKDLVS